MRQRYTPDEDAAILCGSYDDFLQAGYHRTRAAWQKRREVLRQLGHVLTDEPRERVPAFPQTPAIEGKPPYNPQDWREMVAGLLEPDPIRERNRTSHDYAKLSIAADEPIGLVALSDLHIGSWGTDYEQLLAITDEILSTPNLYIFLLGDIMQLSVKLRSVAEVMDNRLSPEAQYVFAESYLAEIAPRVVAATWGNHDDREEQLMGTNRIGRIYAEKGIVFHGGIGHLDLTVGRETYKIAASHHFQGRSMYDPAWGAKRYIRMQAPDREIAMAGDSHVPGHSAYYVGDEFKVAINGGTIQTNSSYAKKYFSLKTIPAFPVVELWPDEHRIIPFPTIGDWLGWRDAHASDRV